MIVIIIDNITMIRRRAVKVRVTFLFNDTRESFLVVFFLRFFFSEIWTSRRFFCEEKKRFKRVKLPNRWSSFLKFWNFLLLMRFEARRRLPCEKEELEKVKLLIKKTLSIVWKCKKKSRRRRLKIYLYSWYSFRSEEMVKRESCKSSRHTGQNKGQQDPTERRTQQRRNLRLPSALEPDWPKGYDHSEGCRRVYR